MKARVATQSDIEKLFADGIILPMEAFESLCVFSVRYCQCRRTYAPHAVLPIVLFNLNKISNKTLSVLISDYEYAKRMGDLGDHEIDKPIWDEYASKLYAEREDRRKGLA